MLKKEDCVLYGGGAVGAEAGFGGFLQKSFRRRDLGKKVRGLLGVPDGLEAE
jgi:hypothetical protein